jgi:signal peptidase II
MRLLTISAVFWFVIDQASKYGVLYGLNLAERGWMDIVPPLLRFHLGWNTGINFGLFAGAPEVTRFLLVGIAFAMVAWMIWWAKHGLTRPIALICAGGVVGGALGNALDRIIHGAVIDFLNMSCCGIDNPFVFNIADIGIVGGAIGLLLFADKAKQEA